MIIELYEFWLLILVAGGVLLKIKLVRCQEIPARGSFWLFRINYYLRWEDGEVGDDVSRRIKSGWVKWRNESRVLYDGYTR